ncbi:hypothetical protein QGM61_13090, partial [Pseudohongiella sp. SYSU M77423]|uniref:hypothetical protein n=1 Tax=Pseudohongiella sp. SYSU M77423 TaxID=3042312 RepID=UPI00248077DF
NSEVKPLSADGSVGPPHVRVGHRQASKSENPRSLLRLGIFFAPLQSLPMSVGHSDSAHPWASPLRGAVNGVQNGSPAVLSGIKKKQKSLSTLPVGVFCF